MSEKILEAEYKNDKNHTAFMTGQITCTKGGEGKIIAELFDDSGKLRFDLAAGAHEHGESCDACNTLMMPVPPDWSVKCHRQVENSGVETRWAEID